MRNRYFLFLSICLFICTAAVHGNPNKIREDLSLSFVGDIMAHNVNYWMEDYSLIYRSVERILKGDDLTFTNLEFPVDPTLPQASYPRFNNHPGYVAAAINAGIEVFSLANNHTNDMGVNSIFRTMDSLALLQAQTQKKIYFSGTRRSLTEDFEPVQIHLKGWNIGYLAVTQFQNLAPRDPYVVKVNYMIEEDVEPFLKWLAKITPDYDLFILSYHGGVEYARKPHPMKTKFFHRLLDAGVNIVHGHHPHVLQPVETVQDNGYNRVILYSTGNFISGQGAHIDPSNPDDDWSYTGDSAIFTLTVELHEGGATVSGVRVVLTTNLRTPNRHYIIEPLEELSTTLLNEPWAAYFKRRNSVMKKFIEENTILTKRALTLAE